MDTNLQNEFVYDYSDLGFKIAKWICTLFEGIFCRHPDVLKTFIEKQIEYLGEKELLNTLISLENNNGEIILKSWDGCLIIVINKSNIAFEFQKKQIVAYPKNLKSDFYY